MVTALGHEVHPLQSRFAESPAAPSGVACSPDRPATLPENLVELGVSNRSLRRMADFAQLSLFACSLLKQHSGSEPGSAWPESTGVIIGSSAGGAEQIDLQLQRLRQRGPERVSAFFIPLIMANAGAGQVAITNRMAGPALGVSNGTASAFSAIAEAFALIQAGTTSQVICGGIEAFGPAPSANLLVNTHASLQEDSPTPATIGNQVAGLLLLEERDAARNRGASILGEVSDARVTFAGRPPHFANGSSEQVQCRVCCGDRQIPLKNDLVHLPGLPSAVLAPVLAANAARAGAIPTEQSLSSWLAQGSGATVSASRFRLRSDCPLGYRGKLEFQTGDF